MLSVTPSPRVEDDKDKQTMETQATAQVGRADGSAASRAFQLGLSAILGIVVVGFVGFSHLDVVHNASHDYRHSMAFPCH